MGPHGPSIIGMSAVSGSNDGPVLLEKALTSNLPPGAQIKPETDQPQDFSRLVSCNWKYFEVLQEFV